MQKLLQYISVAFFVAILSGCGSAKLSVADEQMARGEYYDASRTYRKVYNNLTKKEERQQRGVVAFRMAECYRHLNMSARASAAYQNAIRYGYPDSMAYFHLGKSLQAEGKYQPAIKAYEEFLATDPKGAEAATIARNTQPTRMSGFDGFDALIGTVAG